MAILDFMPKFAPWYTKTLLKKEDEPATDPSTGFFGDVFNFIADDFGWAPVQKKPVEPDWGGAALGAGLGEQAPAYQPYIGDDGSGMGDPFGMNDPFTEEDWVSAPSTPSPFSGPILGGMFGSAPPVPTPGIGEAIGGSLGSGEGWGFDLIDEPTQSWAGYAPPPSPSPWEGGIAGGLFAAPPPTSYPDISEQWQATDWVSPPPRESFGENFGSSFRERLGTATAGRDPWADVMSAPPVATPEPQFAMDQIAGVPGNGFGAAIGDAFSGFGAGLGAQIAQPREFAPLPPIEPTWMGAGRGAEIGANAPFADRTQVRDIGYYPTGWEQMSPKERGEYVYFSGLRGDDYLSENDYANMPVDLKQKIGYTDSRIEGGISNGFASIWDKIDTAFTQPLQLTGDLAYDPIKSMAQDVNPLDLPGLLSASPTSYANVIGDVWGDRQNIEVPLDETVANVQESSNPFEFFDKQGEDFKDRPFLEQLLLGVITPGSGIYKNIPAMPRALTSFDSAVDLVQGGALLDNIGAIPGASTALKNVIIPGGVGAGGGALTEAIFDPTYSDQWGNEYDPGYLEMMLGGAGLAIGGKQALRSNTVPFGAGIDDVGRSMDEFVDDFNVTRAVDDIVPTTPAPTLAERQAAIFAEDPDAAAVFTTPGAVTPSTATDVTPAVTPPVATSSPVVADGVVATPTPKPVISRPVPADLSPAARNAVEQLDAKLDNLISVNADARLKEFRLIRNQIAADARAVADLDETLTPLQKVSAGNAAVADLTIDDLVPIVDDPGRLVLSEEELQQVATIIKNRKMDEGVRNGAVRILKKWMNGEKVYKTDLDTLRTAITGTWNPNGPRTINSIVPPSTVVADGAVDAIPPAAKATTVPKGVDVNKPVPGMKQPINKTIDEVADLPLTPAEKNTIGVDDDFFMEEPIDAVEDEWVDINDWWRDDDVITPGAQAGPPKPRRTPLWKTAIAEAETQTDDQIIDFTKPAVTDDVIDFTSQAAKKTNPIIQEVDAWEKQMLARGQGADPEKFQKELDRSMTELVARLGPDAVKPAQFSRDRIPVRIARLAETNKADRIALGTKEAIADWRKMNLPELDDIKMYANTSWGERYVGGALKNKLADALTSRGRELSEFLQKQGYSFEESKAITEMELSRYLDARTLREAQNGNPNAMLEHALTALHMGDFRPTVKGVDVAEGTGDVAKFIEGARTGNAALKNLFFGIADVGALMANAIPAVQAQGIPIAVGYLNRLTKLVDIDEVRRLRDLSGLAPATAQDVLDDKVGTLAGVAGRFLQGTGASKAGDALVKADQIPVALNRLLEKVQFDLVLSKSLREPAFEGNVVLLKLLGRDVSDPKVLRAASRMANAATSAAPLARGNTRRGIEGATLGSARFLRAQADLILAASKIINPRASMDERIVASMAILSLGGTFFAAKAIAGEKMEVDPKDPYSFGQVLLPGGLIMPSLQQRQLAMAFVKSGRELEKVLMENNGDVSKIMDPWIQFTISRTGPLGAIGLKQFGIGYDPKEDRYSYPGEGRSPWGSSMSFAERMKNVLPVPVGATAFMDNEGPTYGKVLNVTGAGTRPEDPFAAALRAEGYDSLEDMEAEDPKTYSSRKAAFYEKYPDIFEQDTALADYQAAKKSNSEKFMENDYEFTVGDWREERKRLSDGMGGVYNEMGVEEKRRPKEDGSAQWIYDYNQTFADALVNTENTAMGMDMEKLGDLQAEFWAEHPEPEVRKEILDYQLAKADTEADKLWIKSMARLNGFDPNTGKPLTTPSGKKNLPNYFEMTRYKYKEISNEDAQDVIARFVQWRDSLPERYVESKEREELLRQFLKEKDDLNYRPDSKPWNPVAINDVITYGRESAETPEYAAYKKTMRPELLWFSDDKSWKTIQEAHKKAGRE